MKSLRLAVFALVVGAGTTASAQVFIAVIVSVNGEPARGVMVRRGTRVGLTTNQVPGQAIADTTRGFIDDGVWEIQTADGTAVGTFTTHGSLVARHLRVRQPQPQVPTSR